MEGRKEGRKEWVKKIRKYNEGRKEGRRDGECRDGRSFWEGKKELMKGECVREKGRTERRNQQSKKGKRKEGWQQGRRDRCVAIDV